MKKFSKYSFKTNFISALKNIKRDFLLNKLYKIYNNSKKLIKNKDVNDVLKLIQSRHQPVFNKKSRPIIKFLRQVNSKPIIFKAFGNKLTSLSKIIKIILQNKSYLN